MQVLSSATSNILHIIPTSGGSTWPHGLLRCADSSNMPTCAQKRHRGDTVKLLRRPLSYTEQLACKANNNLLKSSLTCLNTNQRTSGA
jgi:hypothetical protein